MKKIDLSIIVPFYNSEEYLTETLDNISCFTDLCVELILVDDGSTDNSASIAKRFSAENQYVKILTHQNNGLGFSRNRGIRFSGGEFIFFLDSDDLIDTKCLEEYVRKMQNEGLDLLNFDFSVFCREERLNSEVQRYQRYLKRRKIKDQYFTSGQQLFKELIRSNSYRSSACQFIFRSVLLKDSRLDFHEDCLHEDDIFTPKVLVLGEFGKCYVTSRKIYSRRIRSNSITTQQSSLKHFYGLFLAGISTFRILLNGKAEGVRVYLFFHSIRTILRSIKTLLKVTTKALP